MESSTKMPDSGEPPSDRTVTRLEPATPVAPTAELMSKPAWAALCVMSGARAVEIRRAMMTEMRPMTRPRKPLPFETGTATASM